jgi:hypothetical protein
MAGSENVGPITKWSRGGGSLSSLLLSYLGPGIGRAMEERHGDAEMWSTVVAQLSSTTMAGLDIIGAGGGSGGAGADDAAAFAAASTTTSWEGISTANTTGAVTVEHFFLALRAVGSRAFSLRGPGPVSSANVVGSAHIPVLSGPNHAPLEDVNVAYKLPPYGPGTSPGLYMDDAVLYTTRDVLPGEELLTSYGPSLHAASRWLRYGFVSRGEDTTGWGRGIVTFAGWLAATGGERAYSLAAERALRANRCPDLLITWRVDDQFSADQIACWTIATWGLATVKRKRGSRIGGKPFLFLDNGEDNNSKASLASAGNNLAGNQPSAMDAFESESPVRVDPTSIEMWKREATHVFQSTIHIMRAGLVPRPELEAALHDGSHHLELIERGVLEMAIRDHDTLDAALKESARAFGTTNQSALTRDEVVSSGLQWKERPVVLWRSQFGDEM